MVQRIKDDKTKSPSTLKTVNEEIVAHGTSTLMTLQGKGIDLSNRKFLAV